LIDSGSADEMRLRKASRGL